MYGQQRSQKRNHLNSDKEAHTHKLTTHQPTVAFAQELCGGGDWFQRLLARGTYSERQAADTIRTLLQTLSYCHSLGVVHR